MDKAFLAVGDASVRVKVGVYGLAIAVVGIPISEALGNMGERAERLKGAMKRRAASFKDSKEIQKENKYSKSG